MLVYSIETIDRDLLHSVYTVNLSVEDATKLKNRMLRKRKINLAVLIFGAVLFFCGLLLPLLLYLFGAEAIVTFLEDNISILFGGLFLGFAGIMVSLFAANKCFAIASSYLKALRIAYPGLPHKDYRHDDSYYHIVGKYDPKEYRTGKRNRALLESLASAQVDKARARGLLNYAVSGKSQSRGLAVFSFVFAALSLSAWAYVNAYAVQILDGTADKEISLMLLVFGIAMLMAFFRWVYVFRANCLHMDAIRTGYPQLFESKELDNN